MYQHRIAYNIHDIHKKLNKPIDSVLSEVANSARGYFNDYIGHGYIKYIHLQNVYARYTDTHYQMYAKADMTKVQHGTKTKFEKVFKFQKRFTPVIMNETKGNDDVI